jgi:type IV pilus assembly protein PilA
MRRARDRAFTLIEALIVSTIVSILAVLAVVGYRRWIMTAYMAEAQDMVSHIRSAEDAFKAENGGYLKVSQALGLGFDYPLMKPGASKTGWGADCDLTACVQANSWKQLAVQPNGPVLFGYSVVADNGGTNPPPHILVNNVDTALDKLTGAPWYVVEADGDPKGTGEYIKLFASSGNDQVFINGETQ